MTACQFLLYCVAALLCLELECEDLDNPADFFLDQTVKFERNRKFPDINGTISPQHQVLMRLIDVQILFTLADKLTSTFNLLICSHAMFGVHLSARNNDQKLVSRFLKIGYFIGYYTAVPLKMYGNLADQNGFWSAKC